MIVRHFCDASWIWSGAGDGTGSGAADNALGSTPVVQKWVVGGAVDCQGYGYAVAKSAGLSPTVTLNPSASLTVKSGVQSGAYAGGSPKFRWHTDLFPVLLSISGTYDPAHGDFHALTGQQITATLAEPNGLPSGTKITKYTWSFGGGSNGNPIKNWDYTNNSVQLVPFLPADLTKTDTTGNGLSVPAINFYDQTADQKVTATCTINLKFPDGTTNSVTAVSPTVIFAKPTLAWAASAGGAFVNASGSFGGTEYWNSAKITVPSPFTGGTGCFAQLITPSRQATRTLPSGASIMYATTYYAKIPDSNGGWKLPTIGLDTAFPCPYGYTANPDGSPGASVSSGYTWDVSSIGISGDKPGSSYSPAAIPGDNGGTNWYTATMQDSFTTWVMYMPPASATGTKGIIWVPLQKLAWSENITVSNTSGVWALNPGSAVTSAASGTDANDPPGWSNVNIASQTQMRP